MRLDPLIRPNSIAIVGASETGTSSVIFNTLDRLGFEGDIFAVNPRRATVFGRECFPSLYDLPGKPDVVALALGGEALTQAIWDVPKIGAGAAVIYQGGFSEHGPEGERLQRRMEGLYREAGVALCGPNGLGILNPVHRSSTYLDQLVSPVGLSGQVGFVSHSGSLCISMLSDVRRYGFSTVISAGNEAVVTAAAYIDYLVDDPKTMVIAAFLETVREPEQFVAALDRAAEVGKPVVILKVGKSIRAKHSITTHTAGLAGDARVFSEVLRRHKAIEVEDQDQLSEVLAVLQSTRRPQGRRTVVVTSSGGQAELILDLVGTAVELPPLRSETREKVEALIGPITGDGNPLDAWGPGNFGGKLFEILRTLDADDEIDNVVLCRDATDAQPMAVYPGSIDTFMRAAKASSKPHLVLSLRSGLFSEQMTRMLRAEGLPTLTGLRQGLKAIGAIGQPRTATRAASDKYPRAVADFPIAVAGRSSVNEHDAKKALATLGLRVTKEHLVPDISSALSAASDIGYPVVLKAISDDIPHKSEFGLVILGIQDEVALRGAWARLETNLTSAPQARLAGFLVQESAPPGVEIFIGVSCDASFGPMIAFGLGGVTIELHNDVALRKLPLLPGDVRAMVDETRAAIMLDGFRGDARASREDLEHCIMRVAEFAWRYRETIREIDINPVRVFAEGCGYLIVDALMIGHDKSTK